MINVLKKTSALLLSLVMMVTFMPMMAFAAEEQPVASVDNIEVCLNGTDENPNVIGYLTRDWLNEHEMDEAQAFPWATKKNFGLVNYGIAKGVDLNDVFEYLGLTEAALEGATLYCCEGAKYDAKNPLKVDHLVNATKVMKGAWDTEGNKDGRKFIKLSSKRYAEVTPVLASAVSTAQYPTYSEALDALDNVDAEGFWNTGTKTRIVVGNTGSPYWKLDTKDGQTEWIDEANDGAIDCCARYGIENFIRLNIVTADPAALTVDKASVTFNNTKAQKVTASLTPASAELASTFTWKSSDAKVAKVDKTGKITPVGLGKCNVTVSVGELSETVSVTVNNKAFTPAKATGLTAKNVKTKKVNLTWKKVTGATGYKVAYQKKGASKWTVKNTKNLKYTVSKLTKNKTYKFKVAAYKTISEKTLVGAYSTVKSVTIKK